MSQWNIENIDQWSWKEHPKGAVVPEAGNAVRYRTGGWRTQRPERDQESCNQCLFCFIFCPDTAVIVENEEVVGFDLEHCKGCGICAYECPKKAIEMLDEAEAEAKGGNARG